MNHSKVHISLRSLSEYFSSQFVHGNTGVRIIYSIYVTFKKNHHVFKIRMVFNVENVMQFEKKIEYLHEHKISRDLKYERSIKNQMPNQNRFQKVQKLPQ